jgi:16S rRNA G527 N7-methylase RsmG
MSGPEQHTPSDKLEQVFRNQLGELAGTMRAAGFPWRLGLEEHLLSYALLVARRAMEFRLVSRNDVPHIVTKHVAASLGAFVAMRGDEEGTWVDVGSGAGFPGLVLKLWDPGHPVVLVESSQRRALFLAETGRMFRLGVAVVSRRIQELSRDYLCWAAGHAERSQETLLLEAGGAPKREWSRSEEGDKDGSPRTRVTLMMRAVDPLERARAWVGRILRPGDRWLVYGGPRWEVSLEAVRRDLESSGVFFVECVRVPWATSRILVFEARG